MKEQKPELTYVQREPSGALSVRAVPPCEDCGKVCPTQMYKVDELNEGEPWDKCDECGNVLIFQAHAKQCGELDVKFNPGVDAMRYLDCLGLVARTIAKYMLARFEMPAIVAAQKEEPPTRRNMERQEDGDPS